jgi:hypothetical protein
MGRAEVVTVVARAVDAARPWRPGRLEPAWLLPLAVLLGGLVFAELRFSSWYVTDLPALGIDPFGGPDVVVGFVVVVGVAVATARGAAAWARRLGGEQPVLAAVPWLVVGFGLSAAVERDRLWTSAQLVLVRASDPFGTGADLFGTAGEGVIAWPYGVVARLWVQVTLLGLAGLAGVVAARRRGRGHPAAVVLVVGWIVLGVLSAAAA